MGEPERKAKTDIPRWHLELVNAVRQALRQVAPCRSHKHDGVHSDMSCWGCGGSLIANGRAEATQAPLDALVKAICPTEEG